MVGGNILADLTNDLLLMNVQLHSLPRSRPILPSGHDRSGASRDLRMRIARFTQAHQYYLHNCCSNYRKLVIICAAPEEDKGRRETS